MKKTFKTFLVLVLGLFLMAGTAMATSIMIDFGDAGLTGGTILSNGITASGSNIPIGVMRVQIGNAPIATYWLQDTSHNATAFLSFDTLSTNNFIKINGSVSTLGVSGDLLSGTISSANITASATGINVSEAVGPDNKLDALLRALGISTNTEFAYFGFSLSGNATQIGTDGVWSGTATSTDIKNTSVPEPTTLLLLGFGLVGLAGAGRKFKK